MEIVPLQRSELDNAISLVWDVFIKYEGVNYSENGKRVFWDAIHSEEYLDRLDAYGAFHEDKLVGIIATRNEGSHIALFFVDGNYHRMGIGRRLFQAILSDNIAQKITVHSSLYAAEVYKKLGFVPSRTTQEEGGILYIPMEYKIDVISALTDKDDKKAYALSKK